MESFRDQAIIVGRKPFGEADLLLTLLTAEHGKLRVVAKGARRPTSRLVGYTELFSVIDGRIDTRTSIPILSQVVLDRSIAGIAEHALTLERFSLLAEVVDKAVEEDTPLGGIYDLLYEGMGRLQESYRPLVFSGVLLRLLGLLGYAPEVTSCVLCKVKLQASDTYAWDHTAGGIVAHQCATGSLTVQPLSEEVVRSLRYLQRSPLTAMERVATDDATVRLLHELLVNYTRHVLEKPLITARSFFVAQEFVG